MEKYETKLCKAVCFIQYITLKMLFRKETFTFFSDKSCYHWILTAECSPCTSAQLIITISQPTMIYLFKCHEVLFSSLNTIKVFKGLLDISNETYKGMLYASIKVLKLCWLRATIFLSSKVKYQLFDKYYSVEKYYSLNTIKGIWGICTNVAFILYLK